MTDENKTEESAPQEESTGKVLVGFHPLGGIRLQADGARLSPQEAFVLAGQLQAHATILIQQSYMEAAMAEAQAAGRLVGPNGERLI